MKKFLRILILLVTIPTVGMVIAATISAMLHDSGLKKENIKLKEQIAGLNSMIEGLKNEPQVLYARAHDQKKHNQFSAARTTLTDLKGKYPDFSGAEISHAFEGIDVAEKAFQEAQIVKDALKAKQDEQRRIETARLAEQKRIESERAREEAMKLAEQKRLQDEKDAALRAKNLAIAVKSLVKTTDDIKDIDWYRDAGTKETNNQKNVHAYIASSKGRVWLRFKMSYSGDDWLFVKSVSFKVDDKVTSLDYGLFNDWERDNGAGDIWEWKDSMMDAKSWSLINSIADSKKTIMRYEGRQYQSDREIGPSEKKSLKNVIKAFEAMGGTPPN